MHIVPNDENFRRHLTNKNCSILDEAGAAIAAWFSGLSGKALETAIREAFERFDADGTGLLDR